MFFLKKKSISPKLIILNSVTIDPVVKREGKRGKRGREKERKRKRGKEKEKKKERKRERKC